MRSPGVGYRGVGLEDLKISRFQDNMLDAKEEGKNGRQNKRRDKKEDEYAVKPLAPSQPVGGQSGTESTGFLGFPAHYNANLPHSSSTRSQTSELIHSHSHSRLNQFDSLQSLSHVYQLIYSRTVNYISKCCLIQAPAPTAQHQETLISILKDMNICALRYSQSHIPCLIITNKTYLQNKADFSTPLKENNMDSPAHKELYDKGYEMRKKVVGEEYVAAALEKGSGDFMRPLQQFATVCRHLHFCILLGKSY
jgi:hypothetical protein